MRIIDRVTAIRSLHKNSYHQTTETVINWKDGHTTTDAENNAIDAELIRLQALEDYQAPRKKEYPSIGDQLDALYHAGVFPSDMTATIKAVKDKYPKE
tara:strand:- start:34 stop:327 length:294 start_codon:yes stop_codon:yes gene_type:complete